MLNKLCAFATRYGLIDPGDRVICAISGGADSVALLFSLYLLRQKLSFTLEAAHFNHHLRGEESDRDENFVKALCHQYDIPLHLGGRLVKAGKKGLEAAARDARYDFLRTLPGKIATAHTADDNAETVLMHMVRGTGLRGLGGIAPKRDNLIRPMLEITRQEILNFLEEYHLQYVTDSSNETDSFLRNRLRHRVMPVLREENPNISQGISAMALRLREDEKLLSAQALPTDDVRTLRKLPEALRNRALDSFLKEQGVPEPEAQHIALVEKLVFSDQPSARAALPGGVVICRNYGKLEKAEQAPVQETLLLNCPGEVVIPRLGLRICCAPAQELRSDKDHFTVQPRGSIYIRCRQAADTMRLSGGTKSLKKIFIDRKIPAAQRIGIPVIADEKGVLAVYNIGPNRDRLAESLPAVEIHFERV